MAIDARKRWLALYVLCAGELMIVLDTTIVGVALPSIREDLRFTEASLVWVVNAYMLTYGGFLLLGGRLGDLYGQRRLFVGGTLFFTAASLACGFVKITLSGDATASKRLLQAPGHGAEFNPRHHPVRPRLVANREFDDQQAHDPRLLLAPRPRQGPHPRSLPLQGEDRPPIARRRCRSALP